jgi:hypothetical protein
MKLWVFNSTFYNYFSYIVGGHFYWWSTKEKLPYLSPVTVEYQGKAPIPPTSHCGVPRKSSHTSHQSLWSTKEKLPYLPPVTVEYQGKAPIPPTSHCGVPRKSSHTSHQSLTIFTT